MPVYKVWRVECDHCGEVIDYGEDECSLPDECEHCGEPIDEPAE
jgi:hypothetical protein